MTTEQWKDIPEFPNYQVSNYGHVYSKSLARCLRPYSNGTAKGYLKVKLTNDAGQTKQRYLHQLTAEAFVFRAEGTTEVNHVDNDPTNNHASNLEWTTRKQNAAHKLLNRLFVFQTVTPLHEQFFSFA